MLFTFDVRNTNGILMPIDGLFHHVPTTLQSKSNTLLHENMLQKIFMNALSHWHSGTGSISYIVK